MIRMERVRRVVAYGGVVAPCAMCGHDVPAVTPIEATRLLQSDLALVNSLIASGQVHAIDTVAGPTWICRNSLFRRTP